MKTIAYVNRKGGVGKSSCVLHLGGAMARRGMRTLIVDMDPQHSLSQGMLGPPEASALDPSLTVAGLYELGSVVAVGDLLMHVGRPWLRLLAGSERMTDHNWPRPWEQGQDQFILRDALAEVDGDFDYCLIDCPPHIQGCAWSSLAAADGVVIPFQAEDFGIQGLVAMLASIEQARAEANPGLALVGFLATMHQKALTVHSGYLADLRSVYGPDVFDNAIPAAKDFEESVTLRKAVCEYKPKAAASKAAEAVVDELLARVAERCGGEGRGAGATVSAGRDRGAA